MKKTETGFWLWAPNDTAPTAVYGQICSSLSNGGVCLLTFTATEWVIQVFHEHSPFHLFVQRLKYIFVVSQNISLYRWVSF